MKFRRWVFPLGCALFLVFVWLHASQARAFWQVLGGAHLAPLALAGGLQLAALCNQPALFASLYALVGLPATWGELAPVVWAGRFVNVVAPAAGLGETALLFDQARRRDWDLALVALVTTLYFALNFAVFAGILVAGCALLLARGDLRGFEVWAALPLMAAVGAGALALWQIARNPDALALRLAKWLQRLPLWVQNHLPAPQKLGDITRRYAISLGELRGARAKWARPALHALLVDGLEMAVLAACLRAFGVAVSPAILVASYAIGTLFTVVSLTPQGIGAVEGALGATLVSFGVSLPHAGAIVLAYRGLSFWLPLLVGFAATRVWSKTLGAGNAVSVAIPISQIS